MEVYSIINDLDQQSFKYKNRSLYDAFTRNKFLLKRYSKHFLKSTEIQFRRKVRNFVREASKISTSSSNKRISAMELRTCFSNQQGFPPYKSQRRILQSCQNKSQKLINFNILKRIHNTQRRSDNINKMNKRVSVEGIEGQNWKIKKISLGEDLEGSDEKIQIYLKQIEELVRNPEMLIEHVPEAFLFHQQFFDRLYTQKLQKEMKGKNT